MACGVECDQEICFQATAGPEVKKLIDKHLPSLKGSSEYQELDSSYLLLDECRETVRKRHRARVEQDSGPLNFGASEPDLCMPSSLSSTERKRVFKTSVQSQEPSRAGL